MMKWIHEQIPRWDEDKARIVGGSPEGAFSKRDHQLGDRLGGDWWRVESDGEVVGYGWMDIVWGDGEVLLAVREGAQSGGVGSFILEQLAHEAARRGLRYIHNTINPEHPERTSVARWLGDRRFVCSSDGERWQRKVA
jgi:GNAT superfamily N-acetyltransferase